MIVLCWIGFLCFVCCCCLFRFVLIVYVLVWFDLFACLECMFVVIRFGCLCVPLCVCVFVWSLACLYVLV